MHVHFDCDFATEQCESTLRRGNLNLGEQILWTFLFDFDLLKLVNNLKC